MGVNAIGAARKSRSISNTDEGVSREVDADIVGPSGISEESGVADIGDGIVDPETLGESDSEAPFGRFPDGRPRKRRAKNSSSIPTGNTNGKRSVTKATDFVAGCFFMAHQALKQVTGIEELEVTSEESKAVGAAIVELSQEYGDFIPDPKAMAWVNLSKVLFEVYGTRFMAYRMRMNQERAEKRRNTGISVVGG